MKRNWIRCAAAGLLAASLGGSIGCKTGAWGSATPSTNWLSWSNPWAGSSWTNWGTKSKIPAPPSSTATPTAVNSVASKSTTTPAATTTPPAAQVAAVPQNYPTTPAGAVGYGAPPAAATQGYPYGTQPAAYQQPTAPNYQTGPYPTGAAQPQPQPAYGAPPAGPYGYQNPAAADPNAYGAPPAANYQNPQSYGAPPAGAAYPTNTAPAYPANNAYPTNNGGGYPANTGGGYPTGGQYQNNTGGGYPTSDAGNPAETGGQFVDKNTPGGGSYPVRNVSAEAEIPSATPAVAVETPAAAPERPSVITNASLPANLQAGGGYRPGSTGGADSGRVWR